MKKIVKIVSFRGNSGNSGMDKGGDGVLNSNHRGMGRGKTAEDLRERVPWVPRGIPTCNNSALIDERICSSFLKASEYINQNLYCFITNLEGLE